MSRTRTCEFCGTAFGPPGHSGKRFCGLSCAGKARWVAYKAANPPTRPSHAQLMSEMQEAYAATLAAAPADRERVNP